MSIAARRASWTARLALRFDRAGDATRLVHNYGEAPLKVMRAWYPEGPARCHVMVLHNAGGMVAGDGVAIEATLGAGAHAVLTTASAGKVYRSEGAEARQDVVLRVGEGAIAEWCPHETILFRGARYRQSARVELAPGARYLGWELTRFGRTAMGERFDAGDWRGRTEVWRGDAPLWIDRQRMIGDVALLDGAFGLAGCAVAGTLAFVGRAVTPDVVADLRALWEASEGVAGEVGVSRIAHGVVCRYRGHSAHEARRWFEAARARLSES